MSIAARRLGLLLLLTALVGGSAADARHRPTDRIVFSSNRDGGPNQIYVMNADGSGQTRLTTVAKQDDLPAWSPDGTRIAFTRGDLAAFDIWVMNPDGSGQVQLTNDPAPDRNPAWSPDGTRIAFGRQRDGYYEIFVMNADGSGQTQLTFSSANEQAPSSRPTGRRSPSTATWTATSTSM